MGCRVGPASSKLFRATPVDDFAEASNAVLILVVVDDSLTTSRMGL